jgi:cytochrome c-type biogenesis protein
MTSPGQITWMIAFVAGVVSFLSPCVLPLVPGYIALISGLSLEELAAPGTAHGRTSRASLLFVAGFSVVFTVLGAFASGLVSPLAAYVPVLRPIAGVMVILFGLHTMHVLPIPILYRQWSFQLTRLPRGYLGPFLVGMAFAFGWTPCVGPILASVLALAASEGGIGRGMGLLFVYSLGIGVPFVLTGFGLGWLLGFLRRYKRLARAVEVVSGALLILVGVLILTNRLAAVAAWFPYLNRFAR